VNSTASVSEFQNALNSLQQDSTDLRVSRQSAQMLMQSVNDALKDIRNEFG